MPDLNHFHTNYDHYYPPHRARRDTDTVHDQVSTVEKIFGALLPGYGATDNAFKINDIALDLEDLTGTVVTGFGTLTPAVQGLSNVALQNRLAMDMVLANQGGVCHVVGTDCCTYIPDISDNMTHVVAHLNDLLHLQKSRDTEENAGNGWWSWAPSTGWQTTLLHLFAPVLAVLVGLSVVLCCVVPLVRSLVTSMISSATERFVQMEEIEEEWVPPYGDQDELL